LLNIEKRVFGLDLARCIAISIVLIAHGLDFFISPVLQGTIVGGALGRILNYPLGFFGVEIFFILSGFLIGNIIIREIVENGTIKSLFNFYIRRWFRTLPLYYLVVVFLILYPTGENFTWENLFFIQNFNESNLAFNPVSWSLSVEEWFYLIIPAIILCIFSFSKNNKAKLFLYTCFFIVLISLITRITSVIFFDSTFDLGTRKQIFFRLDSIMTGVILAGIKHYYKDLYKYLINNRKFLFIISLVGLAICELWLVINSREALNESFFSRTFYFNFVSIFCALFVLSIETVKFNRMKLFVKPVTFISIISYGLYLIHFNIYLIMNQVIVINNLIVGFATFLIALTITLIVSFLIFKYFELPVMKLRDRLNPIKNTRFPHKKKTA
jgi:peptidoglycan/LPS O-acetylase OafA/YrhL